MKYRDSNIDKKLRNWFNGDLTKSNLVKIILSKGSFRGVTPFTLDISYPICAIAGKNGAGKSTILALACCAFHSKNDSYKLPRRTYAYYTFSDFFIQHQNEKNKSQIEIRYHIAHNNWIKTPHLPTGIGIGMQLRKKTSGGKWNDYKNRVSKTVTFLGIDRIVPHAERSQSKSYARYFKSKKENGWETKVKEIVGYILGKKYDEFKYLEHSKYTLPVVKIGDITYSGFNMGAGENALFEIFSTIYSCGIGSLLVLDEIELGLHSEAQKKLIEKLKEVSFELSTQIICTTHSKDIFSSIPPEARFFIESINGKTKITKGISPEFAFGKLSACNSEELHIFVEDEVAKSILTSALPLNIRSRVTINVIGSVGAISRQLANSYIRQEKTPVLAILDGDQRSKDSQNKLKIKKIIENPKEDTDDWIENSIEYLPGDSWPESWITSHSLNKTEILSQALGTDSDTLISIIEYGQQAGKHNEFHEMSSNLGIGEKMCLDIFCNFVCNDNKEEFEKIIQKILALLN